MTAATLSADDRDTLMWSILCMRSPRRIPASEAADRGVTRPTAAGQLPVTVKPKPLECEHRRSTNCNSRHATYRKIVNTSYVAIVGPHRMHEMRIIAVDDPRRLSACLSRGLAAETRLNGSRSCLGRIVLGSKKHCVSLRQE